MIKVPISIKLVGDSKYLQAFIGPAKSQMELLRNFMSFRNLSQGVRRIRLQDNVYVECIKCYNHERCTIVSSEVDQEEIIDVTKNVLLIVYGDQEDILNMYDVNGTFVAEESVSGSGASGNITAVDAVSGSAQTIYGDFTDCDPGIFLTGSSSSAQGIVAECYERYFQRTYEYYEIREDNLPSLIVPMEEYEITSALDTTKPSKISCSDDKVILHEWSKTLNKLMISVFSYYKKSEYSVSGNNKQYWSASASYNGVEITIDGGVNFSEFARTVNINGLANWNGAVKTHIGFDVWQDSAGNYWASLLSDQEETLYVFKYDSAKQDLVLQNSYISTVRDDFFLYKKQYYSYGWYYYDYEHKYLLVRLIGYGYDQNNNQHKAYWAAIENSKVVDEVNYYEEILNEANINELTIDDPISGEPTEILSGIWNPIERKIYIISESFDYTTSIDLNEVWEKVEFAYTKITAGMFVSYWDESGNKYDYVDNINPYTDTYDGSVLTGHTGVSTSFDQYNIDIKDNIYIYPAYFYYPADSYPTAVNPTWDVILKYPAVYYSLGHLIVGDDKINKGTKKTQESLTGIFDRYISRAEALAGFYPDTYLTLIEGYYTTECTPSVDAKQCKLNKIIFSFIDSIVYSYQELALNKELKCYPNIISETSNYYSKNYYCYPEIKSATGTCYSIDKAGKTCFEQAACNITEYNWIDQTESDLTILNAASDTFPYDEGWTSILLSGIDYEGTEHSNWVIYKDLENDTGYFVVDSNGAIYPLGTYDRSFFLNFSSEE